MLEGGFSFGNFLLDVFSIFIFVLWFWLRIPGEVARESAMMSPTIPI